MSKYIVGISGTHGTGKSYLAEHLKPYINVDRSQLSRCAQKALGWESLSKAQESEKNMWALQDAILEAMILRDKQISLNKTDTVVERTPADLFAYTHLWMSRLEIDTNESEKYKEYHERLIDAYHDYKCTFILFPHHTIPFIAEPNRADEESREFVSMQISRFAGYNMSVPAMLIFAGDINVRLNSCLTSLNLGVSNEK